MTEVDLVEKVAAEPVADAVAVDTPPTTPPSRSRAGMAGTVFGGVLAAGIGFGLAQFFPAGWPVADTTALEARLATQDATIAALGADIAAAKATPAQANLQPRLDALEQALAALPDVAPLENRTADLEARFAALEALPPDGSGASTVAIASLRADLERLKVSGTGDVAALTAEAEARMKEAEMQAGQLKAEAEALAKDARARSGLGRVQAALDSGTPYRSALADIGTDIPSVLQDAADTGLPTLASLQDGFPEAARLALEAALRTDMGENWTDRVAVFLRNQTGARSLTPREGSDPDAILSRAEAALTAGDIPAALAEVAALPQVAQEAMATWHAKAGLRLAAQAAIAQSLGE